MQENCYKGPYPPFFCAVKYVCTLFQQAVDVAVHLRWVYCVHMVSFLSCKMQELLTASLFELDRCMYERDTTMYSKLFVGPLNKMFMPSLRDMLTYELFNNIFRNLHRGLVCDMKFLCLHLLRKHWFQG